ncbi:hypothetical protein DUNSADRAFT_8344 [Dunaliella salina]|uniref:Guanylate cyclase domain-containing protein n=1 Tax=Dunaliella salina TaxID=3046 RepID=A0ABQ7GJQ3_DUNSA|nr:hypothetical protein DUNSADRAFT_8344 [Dunaliella salina]|eukprot:KAF5834843.1 hypothetical protein DUNSADRAFT_8344 [Dunaliella salina]
MQAALAWSCAMQECMMARPWSRTVLKEPFKEVRDQHGRLIFRGPRLKIGISQGRPDSIQPDHMGRSDYHGDCVNSAARYMEAAQGGMIVCEQELALKAAEAWSAMRSPSKTEDTTEVSLQPARSSSPSRSAPSFCGLLEQQQETLEDGQARKHTSPLPRKNSSPLPAQTTLSSPQDDEAVLSSPQNEAAQIPAHGGAALLSPSVPANRPSLEDEAALSSPKGPASRSSLQEEAALPSPNRPTVQSPLRDGAALPSPRCLVDQSALQDEVDEPPNSGASRGSWSVYLLQPPLAAPAHTPKRFQRDASNSSHQHSVSHIHVFWWGRFRFKGITHARDMAHVLQDELSSRAAKFTPKSLNPALATLVSQEQPKGPPKSTYLVPLPVVDVDLALGLQGRGVRMTSVRFEHDSSQQDSISRNTGGFSDASARGAMSARSQEHCSFAIAQR